MSQPTPKNAEATALRSILKGSTQYRAKTTTTTTESTPSRSSSRSYIYPGRKNNWLDGAYERLLSARAVGATSEQLELSTVDVSPVGKQNDEIERSNLTSGGNYTTTRQATPDSISDDTLSPSVFGRKTAARYQPPSSFTREREESTPPSSPLYPTLPDATPTRENSGISYPKLPIDDESGAASPLRLSEVKGWK